ncbi:hypothetical protein MHB65_19915 [Lysinibacillus sp. FSL K6-0075]|uniref:hypothetical protein n=1 Tax=Lysinibacillus sp. FSL K6-0075 TaxID=2921415 RepID=UPI003157FEF5
MSEYRNHLGLHSELKRLVQKELDRQQLKGINRYVFDGEKAVDILQELYVIKYVLEKITKEYKPNVVAEVENEEIKNTIKQSVIDELNSQIDSINTAIETVKTTYVKNTDLDIYAKKIDLDSYAKKIELDKYLLKSEYNNGSNSVGADLTRIKKELDSVNLNLSREILYRVVNNAQNGQLDPVWSGFEGLYYDDFFDEDTSQYTLTNCSVRNGVIKSDGVQFYNVNNLKNESKPIFENVNDITYKYDFVGSWLNAYVEKTRKDTNTQEYISSKTLYEIFSFLESSTVYDLRHYWRSDYFDIKNDLLLIQYYNREGIYFVKYHIPSNTYSVDKHENFNGFMQEIWQYEIVSLIPDDDPLKEDYLYNALFSIDELASSAFNSILSSDGKFLYFLTLLPIAFEPQNYYTGGPAMAVKQVLLKKELATGFTDIAAESHDEMHSLALSLETPWFYSGISDIVYVDDKILITQGYIKNILTNETINKGYFKNKNIYVSSNKYYIENNGNYLVIKKDDLSVTTQQSSPVGFSIKINKNIIAKTLHVILAANKAYASNSSLIISGEKYKLDKKIELNSVSQVNSLEIVFDDFDLEISGLLVGYAT